LLYLETIAFKSTRPKEPGPKPQVFVVWVEEAATLQKFEYGTVILVPLRWHPEDAQPPGTSTANLDQ